MLDILIAVIFISIITYLYFGFTQWNGPNDIIFGMYFFTIIVIFMATIGRVYGIY